MVAPTVTGCRCTDRMRCEHPAIDVTVHIADDGILFEIAVEDATSHTPVLYCDIPQAKTLKLLLDNWLELATNVH